MQKIVFKKLARWSRKSGGFTLTEVMIGIMILTVAVVAASNLLVGLLRTNQNNLTGLQAYYLAQEGLEAVRNIRDTNWLHNQDWLEPSVAGELWGIGLEKEKEYLIHLEKGGLKGSGSTISEVRPWKIEEKPGSGGEIVKNVDGQVVYLSSDVADVSGEIQDNLVNFKRVILVKPYDCEYLQGLDFKCDPAEDGVKYALIESKVTWSLGAQERELSLYGVLTNWKGGAT